MSHSKKCGIDHLKQKRIPSVAPDRIYIASIATRRRVTSRPQNCTKISHLATVRQPTRGDSASTRSSTAHRPLGLRTDPVITELRTIRPTKPAEEQYLAGEGPRRARPGPLPRRREADGERRSPPQLRG